MLYVVLMPFSSWWVCAGVMGNVKIKHGCLTTSFITTIISPRQDAHLFSTEGLIVWSFAPFVAGSGARVDLTLLFQRPHLDNIYA